MIPGLMLFWVGAGTFNVLHRWAYLGSPSEDIPETLSEFFLWPKYLYKEFKR